MTAYNISGVDNKIPDRLLPYNLQMYIETVI